VKHLNDDAGAGVVTLSAAELKALDEALPPGAVAARAIGIPNGHDTALNETATCGTPPHDV